jgi:manganese transport system substrate-binding protein
MSRQLGLKHIWNRPTGDADRSGQCGHFAVGFYPQRLAALTVLVVSVLSGCGAPVDRAPPTDRKVILTTFTVLADMTRNVAGDKVNVESIVKPGAEIHGYEPTPSDLSRGQGAVAIFDNGFNLERWATRFYRSFPKVPHITLSAGVQPVEIGGDAYRGKPNPHAWMSPQNALLYVENIRTALGKIDPTNTQCCRLQPANSGTRYQTQTSSCQNSRR